MFEELQVVLGRWLEVAFWLVVGKCHKLTIPSSTWPKTYLRTAFEHSRASEMDPESVVWCGLTLISPQMVLYWWRYGY